MDERIAKDLANKTRDELNVIAKRLHIPKYRKLSKDALLQAISQHQNALAVPQPPSWWERYHNHVYGAATIIGLILTVLFFIWPNTEEKKPTIKNKTDSPVIPPRQVPPVPYMSEAQIASNSKEFSSITMEDYFSRWFKATHLQRDQLEQEMLNKTIIWTGKIKSIESGENGGVRVIVTEKDQHSIGTAFLDFEASQRHEFLKLSEGQIIRFACTIKSFVASPFMKKCKLVQIISE